MVCVFCLTAQQPTTQEDPSAAGQMKGLEEMKCQLLLELEEQLEKHVKPINDAIENQRQQLQQLVLPLQQLLRKLSSQLQQQTQQQQQQLRLLQLLQRQRQPPADDAALEKLRETLEKLFKTQEGFMVDNFGTAEKGLADVRFQLRDLREEAKQGLEQQQQQQQQLVSIQQHVEQQQQQQQHFLQQQQQVMEHLATITNQISVFSSQAAATGTPPQPCDRLSPAVGSSLAVSGAAAAVTGERETSLQFSDRLKDMVANDKYEEAFGLAISADLEKETKGVWVNFVCKQLNPDKIFDAEPPALGQAALLGIGKGAKHPPAVADAAAAAGGGGAIDAVLASAAAAVGVMCQVYHVKEDIYTYLRVQ
ncbi:hypothetical protein EPH_0030130 [Eimeria praecox]|uniref:Uncharacterized protein n=1 Tax=Eimeria praecox TaxID=51316 RepID=U6GGJ1_9EIME|nr:hypothetical protein EPH_0030130 [Eimeria praecox]